MVHAWQRAIAEAYAGPSEPLDAFSRRCLERAADERARHAQAMAALRAGLAAGRMDPLHAARRLTAQADACLQAMLGIAIDETIHRRGAPSGRFSVLGMGKLGGGELTLSSDLDVIFVYQTWSGAYDVAAADYFHRVSQRLIALLSWSPDWRSSYEIDVRLRPHGEDGPLATPLTGMIDYLRQDCWTWELQALTRLRAVAGDADVAAAVLTAARAGAAARDKSEIAAQVADMRALMDQERPGRDLWDLKLIAGGLVDIEFIVQALQLQLAADPGWSFIANTGAALAALAEHGRLRRRDAAALHAAWSLYSAVRQMQSALEVDDLTRLSQDGKAALAATLQASPTQLRTRLIAHQARVRALFEALVGPVRLEAAA